MINIFKAIKRSWLYILVFFIGLALFAVLVRYVSRGTGGDDLNFPIMVQGYSLLEWLKFRYLSWSGRLVAESYVYIFGYLPLKFWKLVDIFYYGVLTFFLYRYYKLFSAHRTDRLDPLMLFFCMALPFGMNLSALTDGTFWVTGAMNYLWIVAAGIAAFYPILYYEIYNKYPHWLVCFVAAAFAFAAGSSQEQVGAVLLVFCIIFTIYTLAIRKKRANFHIIATAIVFIGFLANLLSPGNSKRLNESIHSSINKFPTITLSQRIDLSYRWFMDALINHLGILLILTWFLLIILLIKKSKKSAMDLISIAGLALALLFVAAKNSITFLFDFQIKWRIAPFSTESYIPIAFWSLVLLITVIAIFSLYNYQLKGFAMALLILAVYASAAIMVISQSMAVTGGRTMFVPAIVLCIAILKLIDEAMTQYKSYGLLMLAAYLGFPIYQYLQLANIFFTKFTFHFPW